MRIEEKHWVDEPNYPRAWAEQVLQYTGQITEIKRLLADLKGEIQNLSRLCWSEEELGLKQDAYDFFARRVQATVYYTLLNLERYQHGGWQKLLHPGENCHETIQFNSGKDC